jgi:uncharacterized protein YggU (UPF0235/DUF167 family)
VAAVTVRVTPRGAAERIRVTADGRVSMVVIRPAVDGAATEAAKRLLARALKVPPSTVRLASGARSRLKRFEVTGLDDGELARRIRSLPAD